MHKTSRCKIMGKLNSLKAKFAGTVNDIPVGLQIQAKPLDDEKIVKAMAVFENTQ